MLQVGIAIQETWNFFNEIYSDFQKKYQVSTFKRRTWKAPVFNNRINNFLFQRDLLRFLKENDVVFFEWASELLAAATHIPKCSGIVVRLHRYEMYQWVDKINWDAVDKVIVVSQAKKREFISKFPSQSHKVVVVGPSVSLQKFTPSPRAFRGDIGILGNLTPRKRAYDLILTFYELKQKRDGLHLHIGGGMQEGDQDYYYSLHHIVNKLGLQDSVTFYGEVVNTAEWFKNIDIFVSNSYSEGLQVSPMEAMASGCYCLIHRWDGADELVPEEYLFFTGTELVSKVEQYCDMSEDEKLAHKRLMRGLAEENFDIQKTIDSINLVIEEVAICSERDFGKK